MKKLNLGCGNNIKKSYINLDFIKRKGVDAIHDLEQFPYPFSDNYFNEVYASHIIEHLDNFPKTIHELHRILKKGGKLKIRVPHFSCVSAYSAYHKRRFICADFKQMTKGYDFPSLEYNPLFSKLKLKIKFYKKQLFWNYLIEPLVNTCDLSRVFYEASLCWLFPALEIQAEFIK